jgi:hypothetical protein
MSAPVVGRKTPIDEYNEREKVIADALENINKVSLELAKARPYFRKDLQDKLDRMTFNYNALIEKRNSNRMKGLKNDIPMNKEELDKLIDSV